MTSHDDTTGRHREVTVEIDRATFVATVQVHRAPHNYLDTPLVRQLADVWEDLDRRRDARAIVLCTEGRNFCAGRDFARGRDQGDTAEALYEEAARMLACRTPWVAAVQGAAVGGGLGLAMAADFRIAGSRAWFSANFARLGFHHGFGLSVTLPAVVGPQRAAELLYTGERIDAVTAGEIGLADRVVPDDGLRAAATELAARIGASAPLAVAAIRDTLRGDLADRFRRATAVEAARQAPLRETADFREGIAAARERRLPRFTGR